MSSYKKHILFSLIVALPFFQDVFYLSLAVIGASMIDMDHHVKKRNLITMALFGLLLSIILYIFKLPYLIGISLIIMALIFYLSKHRGFTHSLLGTLILSLLLTFFILGCYTLFKIDIKIVLIVISLILGFITLNRKAILPFIIIVPIGIIITPNLYLSVYYVFLSIFLGCISHIMLDLFTPNGISLLNPLSSKKFKKSMGIVLFILWIMGAFLFNFKEAIFI